MLPKQTTITPADRRAGPNPYPQPGAGWRRRPGVVRHRTVSASYYSTGIALAILFVAPLVWTAWSSITGPRATGGVGGIGTANYERLIDYGEGIWTYVSNSAAVSAMTVGGTLVVACLAGYAMVVFPFPGRTVLFLGTLAILMVPYPTILVPLYVVLGRVGLLNSLVGLALVLVMFQLPFALFMMRNAFDALPKELHEAARMDGCGPVRALWSVLVPAAVPSLITVGIFAFLASWNEFIAPLILLSGGDKYTLPVALAALRSGNFGAIDFGALQAGISIAALPCMVLFVLTQRFYIRGIAAGALK